jgi:hypothetical protein
MPSFKQERAYAIVAEILEQDKERGKIDPRTNLPARMIGDAQGLSATLYRGHRFDVAPTYGPRTERLTIPAPGWTAIRIYDRGNEMMAVNVKGSAVHIAFYIPGRWEGLFGVDWEGDFVRHAWGDPPIGVDLEGQNALRERDLKREPTRGRPPEVDPLRASVVRSGRVRQPQPTPDDPLTVMLQPR